MLSSLYPLRLWCVLADVLAQNTPWLQNEQPHFSRNQVDLFYLQTEFVGTLRQIVIGHDASGYGEFSIEQREIMLFPGAGIFIDHVLVTEDILEGREFMFTVQKWFDSGQVDGKLERFIPLSAFFYLDSLAEENAISCKFPSLFHHFPH